MKIFNNHFEDKHTFVISNWCNNGCQMFHKRNAKNVFDQFNVPEEMRQDVLNAFSDEPVDVKYFIENMPYNMSVRKHAGFVVRLTTDPALVDAVLGNIGLTDIDYLLEQNNPTIIELLVTNSRVALRNCLAWRSDSLEILTRLMNDKNSDVRKEAKVSYDIYFGK